MLESTFIEFKVVVQNREKGHKIVFRYCGRTIIFAKNKVYLK